MEHIKPCQFLYTTDTLDQTKKNTFSEFVSWTVKGEVEDIIVH